MSIRRTLRLGIASLAVLAAAAIPVLATTPALATGNVAWLGSSHNSSGSSGGTSTASVTLPSWTLGSNDLIVITVAETSTKTITTPTGYTAGPTDSVTSGGSTLIYRAFFYKVAASGDNTGILVSMALSAATRWVVDADVFSNADFDTSAYSNATSASSSQAYANVNTGTNADGLLESLGISESSTNGTDCSQSGSNCGAFAPSGGSYDASQNGIGDDFTFKSGTANAGQASYFTPGPTGHGIVANPTDIGTSAVASGDNQGYGDLTVALKPHA